MMTVNGIAYNVVLSVKLLFSYFLFSFYTT